MSLTAPSTRMASPPKLVLLVAVLIASTLTLAPQPVDAAPSQTGRSALAEAFDSRCNVGGEARTVAFHPDIGGSVPVLVKGSASVVKLDEPIPPGSYRVAYLSYDGYPGRESVGQLTEMWVVEFYAEESPDALLDTVGPTRDLDDFVAEAFESAWPDTATTTITTERETTVLAVKHAAEPANIGPNSVRPICINLFPLDDPAPIPVVPGNACGGADLVFRNPDVAYGSSFRKLWKHAPSFELAVIDPPLPVGEFQLIAASYDGYDLRPRSIWETDEVWVAEFWSADGRLVATSSPTMDLPDGPGQTEATWEGPLEPVTLDEAVVRVTVRHAASSDRAPNSVYASCLGVSWIDEPSLGDILARNGQRSLEPALGPIYAAGEYEMEIVAEFTSGHPTNAVGYHLPGSSQCEIVLDGAAGGPGFAGSEPVPFTVNRDFGLCLQGASQTLYSDPDLNNGIAAARAFRSPRLQFPTYFVGFEDFIDGDFQDLVIRLGRIGPTDPLPGLPASPWGREVAWDEIGPEWLLTLVDGTPTDGFLPQGLFLVNPDGERWALYTALRDPAADRLVAILDWEIREALVSVLTPSGRQQVKLVDLQDGRSYSVGPPVDPPNVPKATFAIDLVDSLLMLDYGDDQSKRLVKRLRDGRELTAFGPSVPADNRIDWINAGPLQLVFTNDLPRVRPNEGQMMFVQAPLDTEVPLPDLDCIPLRWIRSTEFAALCNNVDREFRGLELWVVPIDGSSPWPIVQPGVMPGLGVGGLRDLYLAGDRLFLELADGSVYFLQSGCSVPEPTPGRLGGGGTDLVGATEDVLLIVDGTSLLRLPLGPGEAQTLLQGVVDTARWSDDEPVATGSFPSPPPDPTLITTDTCPKLGPGQAAFLQDVRWGLHPTFTRVVFEFEADKTSVPNWSTRYVDSPVQPESPIDDPIEGEGLLDVLIRPSSRVDLTGDVPILIYDGPVNIDVGVGVVEAIDIVDDSEGHLEWIITVDRPRSYKVFTLTSPPRLVVDFAHDS